MDYNNNNAGYIGLNSEDIERQGDQIGVTSNDSVQGAGPSGGYQGNRVHFHDQINEPVQPYGEGEIDISEQQPLDEEETDIVHDLHEAPVSATLIQGNAVVDRENMVSGALDGNGVMGMVNNPFGDHQKTRLRKMHGSGRRSREYEIQANFNEFDQDMDRYSMQNRHVIDEQIQEETFDGNDETA